MGWPLPDQYEITTPYGKRGGYWSCDENSSGDGIHTGVDFGCPSNTSLYATIAGTIRHRNYGSAFGDRQFAISPSEGQPFANGEVFYAHGNERLADGTEVQVGDYVGKSGARGNVSGPHLHYEYHPDTKGSWNCGVIADPGPTLDGGAGGGPYVTKDVYRSKCGAGEPSNGDDFSATIEELQERLNRTTLVGGQELTVNGIYDADTDEEVRLWQEQVAHDPPDPVGQSYLGPNQFALMFPDSIYNLHDDGDPAIASGSGGSGGEGGSSSGTTLGAWLKEHGHVVEDDGVPLGRESTWDEVEFLIVHHTGGTGDCTKDEAGLADFIRTGGDYPPLAQIMLGKAATVWMCCQERDGQSDPGRASQAGEGSGYGVPDDRMNEVSLGIECQCDGSHPLATHPVLYAELILLLASLCIKYGVPVENVLGHKEWSTTGKVDPRDDMDTIRADVQAALDGTGPDPGPTPPEPGPTPDDTIPVQVSLDDGTSFDSYWPVVR